MTLVKLNNVHQVFLSHQKRQFSTFEILQNGLRGFRKVKNSTKSEMKLDELKGSPNFYYVSNRFMFAPERLKNQPKKPASSSSKSSTDRNLKILFGVFFSLDLAVDLYCLKNNVKLKEMFEKIWPDGQWSQTWSEAASEVDKLEFNKETIAAVAITDAIFWALLYLVFRDKNVQKYFTKMRKFVSTR